MKRKGKIRWTDVCGRESSVAYPIYHIDIKMAAEARRDAIDGGKRLAVGAGFGWVVCT